MGRSWGTAAGREPWAGTRGALPVEVGAGAVAVAVAFGWAGEPVASGVRRGAVRVAGRDGGRVSAGRVREALARAEAGGRPPAAEGRARPLPGERGGAEPPGSGGVEAVPTGVRGAAYPGVRGAGFACGRGGGVAGRWWVLVMTLCMGGPRFVSRWIPGSNFGSVILYGADRGRGKEARFGSRAPESSPIRVMSG
ncbi:hypothetical protein GCM10010234_54920 [Streptomyces hawaiiensis]